MSKTGRYYITKIDKVTGKTRTFCVEPISEFANRNSDWNNGAGGFATGGAVHPSDSIIDNTNFKNIHFLSKGESPNSFIDKL